MRTSFTKTLNFGDKRKKVRIDKWLWAVRVFKTRTLASTACSANRVKINDAPVKASRTVKIGERIHIQKGPLKIIFEVVSIIEKRVSYALAVKCYNDHSPPPPPPDPSKKRLKSAFYELPVAFRQKGEGRPTKKDRRKIEKLKQQKDQFEENDF